MANKKRKNISFIVPLHVYPFDVMVSINQSDGQLAHVLDKFHALKKETTSFVNILATTAFTNASLIRIRKLPETPEEYGVLAHEIFHIASCVLFRIGVKLKIQTSDEAYAYLVQYLTEQIYTIMYKHY